MFGDQPEAADPGRNCEICRVELDGDFPRCQICTDGESNLWERIEKLKIGCGGANGDDDPNRLVKATPGVESSTGVGDVAQAIKL